MNVLLIGFGYFPYRITSDKNYWVELSGLLAEHVNNLVILSANDRTGKVVQASAASNIHVYSVPRAFHRAVGDIRGDRTQGYGHLHRRARQILECSATLLRMIPIVRELLNEYAIEVIHFMDNPGPVAQVLKRVFRDIYMTSSAIRYTSRQSWYNLYSKMSFQALDKVVTYTDAYRQRLIELGIAESRLRTIRWGVALREVFINSQEKTEARRELGIDTQSKLVLCSPFIQSRNVNNFLFAHKVARRVVQGGSLCDFILALKIERYEPRYDAYQQYRIRVLGTNSQGFRKLVTATDILLSPIIERNSSVAPPLTWIECMEQGMPIISVYRSGVEEIIIDGQTGYIIKDVDDAVEVLRQIMADDRLLGYLSHNARQLVRERYNIERSAREFLELWQEKG